jgi:hypothetical protein
LWRSSRSSKASKRVLVFLIPTFIVSGHLVVLIVIATIIVVRRRWRLFVDPVI